MKFWGQKRSETLRKFALKLEKKHQTFETAKLEKEIPGCDNPYSNQGSPETGACAK